LLDDPSMYEILQYVDVVCDGEYVEELRDINKHWVGSSNQNVIDVKKRLDQMTKLQCAIDTNRN